MFGLCVQYFLLLPILLHPPKSPQDRDLHHQFLIRHPEEVHHLLHLLEMEWS